jgi:hypothetical protein
VDTSKTSEPLCERCGAAPASIPLLEICDRCTTDKDRRKLEEVRGSGPAVLDGIVALLRRFVSFPSEEHLNAVALWAIHTHVVELFDTTPYLFITSPIKRCGKTTLLDLLELVVRRPEAIVWPSPAILYRLVDPSARPTILIDEIDATFSGGARDDLRGILNAGNRQGKTVPRTNRHGSVDRFDPFCPKVLGGIDNLGLPDTIKDRSITIRLQRAGRDGVEPLRSRTLTREEKALRNDIERYVTVNQARLAAANPRLPDELGPRQADAWEPLLAIADTIGGPWPDKARRAAIMLSTGIEVDEDSRSLRLVGDILDGWPEDRKVKRSAEIVVDLLATDPRSWRRLDELGLARELRRFGVRPATRRFAGGVTAKGYARSELEDIWDRYGAS